MRVDTWRDLNQLLTTAMEWLAETEIELALVEARITQHEEEWAQLWAQGAEHEEERVLERGGGREAAWALDYDPTRRRTAGGGQASQRPDGYGEAAHERPALSQELLVSWESLRTDAAREHGQAAGAYTGHLPLRDGLATPPAPLRGAATLPVVGRFRADMGQNSGDKGQQLLR